MNDQNKHEAPKMIEMPEHLRVEAHSRDLGGAAVKPLDATGGRFNNGVVTIDPADVTPEMIRKAGVQVNPDTYMLPSMPEANSDKE